nr:hypothetical protein [Nonomuraea sp. SYSU D8015]
MVRRTGRLVAGLTLVALAGISPAPASAALGEGDRRPGWRPCTGEGVPARMECATIEVPVDWARPAGRKISLDLARLPATEPARRIGAVLGVPGGPGGKGIEDLEHAAGDLTELGRRFDLVAYNPRTTVWSDRLPPACRRPGTTLSEPRDRRQYEALVKAMATPSRHAVRRMRPGCSPIWTPCRWPGTWRRSARPSARNG